MRVRSSKVGSVCFSAGSSSTLRPSVSDVLSGTDTYTEEKRKEERGEGGKSTQKF